MYLRDKPGYRYVVFDIETNGLNPDTIWCLVSKDLMSGEIEECIGHAAIQKWSISHNDGKTIFVGHNALSFDIPVINRILGCSIPTGLVIDTLVLSTLYHPKMDGGHSLGAYGERFGDLKLEHEDWSRFSAEMLARCRQDVMLTEKVFHALRGKMLGVGFSELSCEIEHHIREVVDWQEDYGFGFNAKQANIMYFELSIELEKLSKRVLEMFPPILRKIGTFKFKRPASGELPYWYQIHSAKYPKVVIRAGAGEYDCYDWQEFNLGSPKQRLQRLTDIGYVAVNKTKAGAPAVDEDGILAFLETCEDRHKPAVEAMAEWLVVNARITMIGGWLEHYDRASGAIHGRVFTCGAMSRRCTHNHPNSANIPANEAKYGPECRALWCARSGRVLLGGDAKAVQMRMFAHYLGNVEVGMQYVEGDPHSRNAEAADIPRKKVKNCFYAMIFGAQDPKLGRTGHGGAGTSKQGAAIRAALYGTTPGLEDLFASADRAYRKGSGWLECIDGGWVRCPSPHAALNYWVQSAEAILMKVVAWKVYRFIIDNRIDARQCGFIHDELQYDCRDIPTAYKVAQEFLRAMEEAGRELKFIIPMAGDTKYALSWEGTH